MLLLKQMEGKLKDWGVYKKVVAFVTDWGSNMLKAGTSLEERLPNMVASVGCMQHLLSLTLKDYGKEACIDNLLAKVYRAATAAAAARWPPPEAACVPPPHRR